MADLVRRDDFDGLKRADESVDAATIAGSAEVHVFAHRVYSRAAQTLTSEARHLSDTEFQFVAPHLTATLDQLGRETLAIAKEASQGMRKRADLWRNERR